jgi:hypothetical protein
MQYSSKYQNVNLEKLFVIEKRKLIFNLKKSKIRNLNLYKKLNTNRIRRKNISIYFYLFIQIYSQNALTKVKKTSQKKLLLGSFNLNFFF